uniref:Ubiquitin-like protease family profile domain-containing protein n=1 Tax=Setaria viridis TaxID=4556 RepID=A0A4U6VQS7_SETVI|nr:hypothetical protein SEVIR_2G149300v2 [Setaria viridis]
MLIQRCHIESYFIIRDQPKKILEVVYNFLDKQNYKEYILLPYKHNFHWILLIIMIDRSHVVVFDLLRKPPKEYQDIQDMLNSIYFPVRMKFAHFLYSKTQIFHNLFFPLNCLRHEQGNNLCGYYVCEHMHSFVHGNGPSSLLEKEGILAICEGLVRLLVDEVIHPAGEFSYDGHSIAAPSNTTMGRS